MADFNVVLEQYRTQFGSIYEDFQHHWEELPKDLENIKTKMSNFNAMARKSTHMTIINSKIHIYDPSPIGTNDNLYRSLMEIYMWISLCLLISSLAFLLGQGALFWLSLMIFDVNVAFLLSLFVLPGVTYYYLRKTVMVEEEGRIVVLVFTLICNFLIGFVFKYRKLDFFPPPVFVAPLSVGLMAAFSSSALQNKPRFAYIFASSGTAFVWYTAFGFIIGSLNFPYFIWTVVYCMLSTVDFQIKLGAMWTDGTGTYSNQIITITLYIMTGFLLNTVFTTSDS